MNTMDRQLTTRLTYILLPIWSGFLISGMSGLEQKDVTLDVPPIILQGKTLVMMCRFPANESAGVYDVKWYKGNREFFKYTPKEHPKIKIHQFTDLHIQVDENKSDMNTVVVKEVPAKFRGNISCEVTVEYPKLINVFLTSYLMVAVPPQSDPVLTVDVIKKKDSDDSSTSTGSANMHSGLTNNNIVNIGDTLIARCTSGPSTPPVEIKYLINDYPPSNGRMKIHQELKEDADNKTATRVATLNMTLGYGHFINKKISIKCVANLSKLYNASSTEVTRELPRENVLASGYGVPFNGGHRLDCGIGFGRLVLVLILHLVLLSTPTGFRR